MSDFSGYPIEQEDRDFLATLPTAEGNVPLFGSYEEQRLDPRELIPVENQGSVGSCQGHALSSCMEWCYVIATNGQRQQLSRAMGYYETQRIDGINGDRGSTISGGVKLARNVGLCEEPLWPYTGRYQPGRPNNWQEIQQNAAKYKIGRAVQIRSYEDFRGFLGSLQGGIHIGIAWGNAMNRAVIETFSPGGGGHAIAGLCLSERVDSQGRPFAWIANSWGQSFGSREYPGWMEWSPTAISQMLRHQWTEMIGISDMPAAKPRKFSLDDWKAKLRV
jgi:hypothetical protein